MNDRDVDQEVRSALATGMADAGPHPEPDALFHYYAGELSAADADAVQDHLALCRACAQAVLDFETFPHIDAPSEDDVPTLKEVEAGWADLQARLGRGAAARRADAEESEFVLAASEPAAVRPRGAVVVPLTPRSGTPTRRVPHAPRVSMALQAAAAVLAATTLGLGGYAFILQRSLTQAAAPTADVFHLDLDSAVTRGAPAAGRRVVTVPATTQVIALTFSPDTDPQNAFPPRCHVEIVRVAERPEPVWSGIGRTDRYGAVSVSWPRASADAGHYRALIRAAPDQPALVEFEFELAYQ